MLPLLLSYVSSKKTNVELAVIYTHACPLTKDSEIVVNEGKQFITASRYGSTYIRLPEGKHSIEVSHPWCTFPLTEVQIFDDLTIRAKINGSVVDIEPIKIKHNPNPTDDPLAMIFGSSSSIMMVIGMVACFACQKFMKSPKVMAKMQNLQAQVSEAQEQMKAQPNNQAGGKK